MATNLFTCHLPAYAGDRPVRLTDAQALTLYDVLRWRDEMRAIGPERTPLCLWSLAREGEVPFWPTLIFSARDNQDNARRRTLTALATQGRVAAWYSPMQSLMRLRYPAALAAYRAWYERRGAQFAQVTAL